MQQPQRVFRLNLDKYGLSRLNDMNLLRLSDTDIDALLEALGKDDISITVPIPLSPEIIRELLAVSVCRRCGGCCTPNPANPEGPGVEVFTDELKIIALHTGESFETLLNSTTEGRNQDLMYPMDEIIGTCVLPLPCRFYDPEKKECRIYQARPLVCTVYPVVLSEQENCIDIKLNCDYGKDVARAAIKHLGERNPDLILRIQ